MSLLEENDLVLAVPDAVVAEKFDDLNHGLSHCMKAVDFILETQSHILFVELKDPDDPSAKGKQSLKPFLSQFESGEIDAALVGKYRDSWIYKRFNSGLYTKPILYLVLIACSDLSSASLVTRAGRLRKKLPLCGPDGTIWKDFVEDVMVFNIASWNEAFPNMLVSRKSDAGD